MKFSDFLLLGFVVGSTACKPAGTTTEPAEDSGVEISESEHIVTPTPPYYLPAKLASAPSISTSVKAGTQITRFG